MLKWNNIDCKTSKYIEDRSVYFIKLKEGLAMTKEMRKLENEFVGYLKDELEKFLEAIKSYDYNIDCLSEEVKHIINKIDEE